MTYLALLHGAKSVLYWASDSGKCDIVKFPDRWEALRYIAAGVAWLGPVLEGRRADVDVVAKPGGAPIDVGIWRRGSKWYIIAINPESEPFDVTVSLPYRMVSPMSCSRTGGCRSTEPFVTCFSRRTCMSTSSYDR